jgi:RND family efflux transporter MFP subunit
MAWLPFISLVLLAVMGLSSCQQLSSAPQSGGGDTAEKSSDSGEKSDDDTGKKSDAAETKTTLHLPITQVKSETMVENLRLPGFVLAKPDRSVKVSPGIAGKIVDIKVGLGQQVRKGQIIAILDDRLLTNQVNQAHAKILVALAGVEQAKTSLLLAQNTEDRNRRLVQQDVGAEKDLIAASSAVETAKAQVLAANAQVEDAKAGEAAAKAQLTYAQVKSPINGLVAQRYLNISDSADTTTPIMQIVDLSEVIIDASLPTTQPANIKGGDPAIIEAKAIPDLKLAGKVQSVNAVTDNQGTTIGVRILCNNPKTELKEGMPVTASIVLLTHVNAATVPMGALVSDPADPNKKMVYAFKDGKIKRVPVEIGIQNKTDVEIKSGLHVGESIVAGGAYGVPDGTEVEAEGGTLRSTTKVTSKSD